MRVFKVRRFLVTEGPDGRPVRQAEDIGTVSILNPVSAFCRARGLAYVPDATAAGGGYGVDIATGATVLAVGWPSPAEVRAADPTVFDDRAEEALWQEAFRLSDVLTTARKAEVEAISLGRGGRVRLSGYQLRRKRTGYLPGLMW